MGYRPKRGHFVSRLVTLKVLIRSASNLAQVNNISFLTLPRNLFQSNFKKTKWRHLANGNSHNMWQIF